MARNFSGQFSSWPWEFAVALGVLLLIVACENL